MRLGHPLELYPGVETLGAEILSNRGLDKISGFLTMGKNLVMSTACDHQYTETLNRIDGVDYVHCMNCGQVFEAEDLEPVAVYDEE